MTSYLTKLPPTPNLIHPHPMTPLPYKLPPAVEKEFEKLDHRTPLRIKRTEFQGAYRFIDSDIAKSFIARVIALEVEKVRREQKEDILKKIPNELLMACFPGGKFTLEWEDGYNCALSDIRSQLTPDTELSNSN